MSHTPEHQREDRGPLLVSGRPPMAASVASGGTSPLSGYSNLFPADASNPDTDESWAFLDMPAGSASDPGSIGFFPSPASGSLGSSYAVLGGRLEPSPPALSPLYLEPLHNEQTSYVAAHAGGMAGGDRQQLHLQQQLQQQQQHHQHMFSDMAGPMADVQFPTPQEWLFTEQQMDEISQFVNTLNTNLVPADLNSLEPSFQGPQGLEIPASMQSNPHESPWGPAGMRQDDGMFVMEGFTPPPPPTTSSALSASPLLPPPATPAWQTATKQDPAGDRSEAANSVRRVRGAGGRVQKRGGKPEQSVSVSGGSSVGGSPTSKFVIVTPRSINAHAGKPNPFECFEAMRPSQKGRKGPLADAAKQNALQVRRLGACFCCHARKVKCDKERPCKSCKKLMVQVPQVVCWQFQDFLTVLFPEFIRGHFRKEEMSKFVATHVEAFTVGGLEQPCTVELSSGMLFRTKLTIRGKFFTAKTQEILEHYHLNVGAGGVDLQAQRSAPIGLDSEGTSQKDEVKKKVKEYIYGITNEPSYALQVTDSLLSTQVPRRVLEIVQNYATASDSPIVKRALSIYAMHYVLTRHLCLTRQTVASLQPLLLVPPAAAQFVTPRMLNRQVKAVVDEQMLREMTLVFDGFSRSLKPKSRREWAPCLAAFLVLCLFMETVETAADNYVLAQREISLRRNRPPPEMRREEALRINREVENLPFKQFAYQFHQIYQTHSRDASAKPFNPLVDEGPIDAGEIDAPAAEMARALRELIVEDWSELDFLTMDPVLGSGGEHPYPMDVAQNYTGRLVSKFLLSFTSESYIFG